MKQEKNEKPALKDICPLTEQFLANVQGGLDTPVDGVPLAHRFVNGVCEKCGVTLGAYYASGKTIMCR